MANCQVKAKVKELNLEKYSRHSTGVLAEGEILFIKSSQKYSVLLVGFNYLEFTFLGYFSQVFLQGPLHFD